MSLFIYSFFFDALILKLVLLKSTGCFILFFKNPLVDALQFVRDRKVVLEKIKLRTSKSIMG